ncbi:MAG: TrkH family potassium uptake protein [Candidatus Omnitrophica bacterium]|nr:TrkH family potassium uptake protein [Candidatus Omnitrophota bacterium]MBU4479389.1 TrkH family potassium uptake protein [Candidatus Omnitrophota bacterium]
MIKIDREKIRKWLDYLIGVVAGIAFLVLLIQWGFKLGDSHRRLFNTIDSIVLCVFLLETVLRFLLTPEKKGYLKKNWIDLIVFVPFVQFVRGIKMARIFIILRQLIVMSSLFSRTKRLQKLISLLGFRPAQLLVVSFLMTILIGAFLLTLPIASHSGEALGFIDALFTATSATCVTGLIVKDTGTFFSLFGQLVILALMQIGALGIMTFSVTLFLAVGKKMSNREAMVMQDVLDQDSFAGILGLIRFIARMTLTVELLGAVFLFVGFMPYFQNPLQCLYISVFHSISAFCNAGFSLFSDSLVGFAGDVTINMTVAFLIIFGGIGFIVVEDIWNKYVTGKRSKSLGLKLHTKLVLVTSFILVIIGTLSIFFAESNCALKNMPLKKQILISFFQSVSTRTAGFNSIDIGAMTNASIFSMIVLMFIGASAGSTGGGIKTTTAWVMWRAFTSTLLNRDNISAFKRKIPDAVVAKSVAVFVLSLGLVIVFMYIISILESLPFRELLFEVVSAFGTVGLSCGITASLHMHGKLLITALMFLGRVGPLTMVLAFSGYRRKINYVYAEERILVG